jgi:2-iminobutanoate/2-iminopropanoate deaminase
MFATLRNILEVAGGSPEDVVKMTVWLKDRTQRPALNKGWLEMFPDEHSRPARHTFQSPDLPGNMLVQCEVYAVITENK